MISQIGLTKQSRTLNIAGCNTPVYERILYPKYFSLEQQSVSLGLPYELIFELDRVLNHVVTADRRQQNLWPFFKTDINTPKQIYLSAYQIICSFRSGTNPTSHTTNICLS
jgi:hypothetical protein